MKTLKLFLLWFLVLTLLIPIALPLAAFAEEIGNSILTEGAYQYEIEDGMATILNYTGSNNVLEIPDTLGGAPVRKIRGRAFYNCGLTKVTVPASVETIDCNAFSSNPLKEISLPDHAMEIDTDAFLNTDFENDISNWNNEKQLYIGNHLIKFDIDFDEISSSEQFNLTVREGTYDLATRIFQFGYAGGWWETTNVQVLLPKSVKKIQNDVFYFNDVEPKSLKVTVLNDEANIAEYAFVVWGWSDSPIPVTEALTLIGRNGSSAQKFAADHSLKFQLLDEAGKAEAVSIEKEGVFLVADAGVFEAGTTLFAETINDGDWYQYVIETLNKVVQKAKVYDLFAQNSNEKVQPNGKVKAEFDIPKEFNLERVGLFYVNQDGNYEEIPSTIDSVNRKLSADLEHFSTYVLAEKKPSSPQTGDDWSTIIWILLLSTATLAATVAFLRPEGKRT